jgi:Cytidylate kinase-like family
MHTHEQASRVAEALRQAGEYPLNRKPVEPPPPSFTIALSREAGSGGALVAVEVGRRLNWPVYDNELLTRLARDLRVDEHRLRGIDERPGSRLVECLEAFASSSTVTEVGYFRSLLRLILELGNQGECVIVGRGAVLALPAETTLRVRVMANHEDRIAAVVRETGLSRPKAVRFVETRDHERSRFIKDHFHKDVADPLLYDVLLNASRFTIDECATIVIESLARLQARKAVGSGSQRGHLG